MHSVLDAQKDKYKFVFEQTANFSQSEALNVTEAGLSGQGKPDVIVAGNDDMALGAVAALQARKINDVAVFGFDAIPEALKLIKSGDMRATIEQYPAEQCTRATRVAVAFLRESKKPDVAVDLITPTLIAKDNINSANASARCNRGTFVSPRVGRDGRPSSGKRNDRRGDRSAKDLSELDLRSVIMDASGYRLVAEKGHEGLFRGCRARRRLVEHSPRRDPRPARRERGG